MLNSVYNAESNVNYHETSSRQYDSHLKALHNIYSYKDSQTRKTRATDVLKKFDNLIVDNHKKSKETTWVNDFNNRNRQITTENQRIVKNLRNISARSSKNSSSSLVRHNSSIVDPDTLINMKSRQSQARKKMIYESIQDQNVKLANRIKQQKSGMLS